MLETSLGHQVEMDRRKKAIGIGIIIFGAICMSTMGVYVKKLDESIPWNEIVFFRFSISFLFFLPFYLSGDRVSYKISQPRWLAIRIAGGALSMMIYFYTMTCLDLSSATLFVMSAPIYVPIFSFVLFKKRISPVLWVGITIAIIGLIIILHPGKSIFQLVSVLGIFSGVMQGISNIATSKSYEKNTTKQILFYYYSTTILILACTLPINWVTPNGGQWIYLFLVSFFGFLFTTCYTIGFKYAPAYIISPFSISSVLFSAFYDWIIWNNLLSESMVIGSIILICGFLIVSVYREPILEVAPKFVSKITG